MSTIWLILVATETQETQDPIDVLEETATSLRAAVRAARALNPYIERVTLRRGLIFGVILDGYAALQDHPFVSFTLIPTTRNA